MSQHTVKEIADMLALNPEAVAVHLLGNGRREGQELRYGDVGGGAGKSLGVRIEGSKAGVWCDFSTGEAGDLLDLWVSARGCDMATAISEAKAYLGIRDVPLAGKVAEAKPIERPAGIHALGSGELYWLKTHRQLSDEAIKAYKLVSRGTGVVAFPYLLPSGELVGMKYRSTVEDKYWAEAGGAKVLFGWQAIPANARTVVLCEGELKALAWWDYGFPALSLPFGGGSKGKQDWIEFEYDRLSRFDIVYLAMDADEPGRAAGETIMARLGPERCALVKLPLPAEPGAKCINACVKHMVSRAAIADAMAKAKPRDPDELRGAADYADELGRMFEQSGPEVGIRMPWKKVGDKVVFRPGELTIIAGRNGHGKSQCVGFMAGYAMAKGHRVCVASLEFKVAAWLKKLVRQIAAAESITPRHAISIAQWLGDGLLWAFDAQGTADWRRMIEVFRYARRRYAVELFVIDNLTGLGIGEEDYQGQKEVTLALANFARDEDCHVWLVHHVRKSQSESDQVDKSDIKGSGSITDLASTVLTVWRNKPKEAKRELAKAEGRELSEEDEKQPDVRLSCRKQRNYAGTENGEPSIRLWWDGASYHYLGKPEHRPRPLLPYGWHERNTA